MSPRRQGGPGEPSGSDGSGSPLDPISAIESALGMLRGRGPGGPFGWGGGPFGSGSSGPGGHGGRDHGAHGGPFGGHAHHEHAASRRGPGGRGGHAALRLLMVLDHGPGSVSDVAAAIGVDQPRASRLVQAAVEAGQVRRDVDPADARRSILVLTDAGRAALSNLLDHRRSAIERGLADFTPAEREQFARLFARFAQAWSRT